MLSRGPIRIFVTVNVNYSLGLSSFSVKGEGNHEREETEASTELRTGNTSDLERTQGFQLLDRPLKEFVLWVKVNVYFKDF